MSKDLSNLLSEEAGLVDDCLDAINDMLGKFNHPATTPDNELNAGMARIDVARAKHLQRVQADQDRANLINVERRIEPPQGERSSRIVGHVVMTTKCL